MTLISSMMMVGAQCPITGRPMVTIVLVLAAGAIAGFLAGRHSKRAEHGPRGAAVGGFGESGGATGEGIELYVGNLPYKTTEKEISALFGKYGKVLSVRLITNKANGRSRGYGFVEMGGQSAADKAVSALSGADVKGRKMVVNEAKSASRD